MSSYQQQRRLEKWQVSACSVEGGNDSEEVSFTASPVENADNGQTQAANEGVTVKATVTHAEGT
jgi:hypothetical protein